MTYNHYSAHFILLHKNFLRTSELCGSLGKAKHWKKKFEFSFLVLILPKYLESAQKCCNFWHIYYISLKHPNKYAKTLRVFRQRVINKINKLLNTWFEILLTKIFYFVLNYLLRVAAACLPLTETSCVTQPFRSENCCNSLCREIFCNI